MATALVAASVVAAAHPLSGQERLTKPAVRPSFTGLTVTPNGPSFIDAGSDMPTNIRVTWAVVPNAVWYRIWRWSTADPKRSFDYDVTMLNTTAQPGYVIWNDKWATLNPTYSYQVQGILNDANGNPLFTAMSSTASAKSVPFLAPANMYLVVSPSALINTVRLTLTWDSVPAANVYYLTGTVRDTRGTALLPPAWVGPTGDVMFDGDQHASHPPALGRFLRYPIYPGNTYRFCLVTYYPNGVHDDTVQKCASITP
jgi:hypothetical protein